MEFWVCLYGVASLIGLFNILVPYKYRILLLYVLVFILWFIASFRYMIGTDYNMYMTYFMQDIFLDVWENGEVLTEPANIVITYLVKNIGFGSQMYFLIYETIIMYFFYQGAKKLSNNVYTLCLAIILYAVICMPGTYYWSMNGIRQAAAISLCFYGSAMYLQKETKKVYLAFILAMGFHLTVPVIIIIFLLTIKFVSKIKFSMRKIIIAVGIILMTTASGGSAKLLLLILMNTPNYGDKYGDYVLRLTSDSSPTFGLLFFLIGVFLFMSYRWLRNNGYGFISNNLYSLVFIFMILRSLTSFQFVIQNAEFVSMIESMLHRVDAYFVPFFILAVARWLNWELFEVKHNFVKATVITMLIIICFSIHSLRNIDIVRNSITMSNNPSAGNIDYQIRLDLINE